VWRSDTDLQAPNDQNAGPDEEKGDPPRHVAGDTLESLCVEEYGDHDVKTRAAVATAANHISRPLALFCNQVVYFPS
ncbi:hypothetical protein, partial [Microtetraspora sp. AC03309]|uniref:hypothetical protein n=1 Tax=Microtetraspora sp. AC03309 TaxID=2779376 RepID=UPI001E50A7D6